MISKRKSPGIEMSRDDRIRLAAGLDAAVTMGTLKGIPGLRRKRIQRGISQRALCEICGFDRQTYNNWEHCRHWPSAKMLPILAAALGCTIEDLFLPDEESEGY